MLSADTDSLRHLPRRSSKNCDMQFANTDRQTDLENYSIDTCTAIWHTMCVRGLFASTTVLIELHVDCTYSMNCDKELVYHD